MKMDKLIKARTEIEDIDKEMAELFVKRMASVKLVSEYKNEHGLPIYDPQREDALIAKNASRVEDDVLRSYYIEFLRDTMKVSRQYQEQLASGRRVAFAGVPGAFASIAAGRIFDKSVQVAYPDFKSAYNAVVNGECDCAVLPIENSTTGEVGQVLDMMFSGPLYVSGVYNLSINQNLMAIPGTKLSDIKKVISHPQALSQCAPYIRDHGFEQTEYANTAMAAQFVKAQNDHTLAAIASDETARLYGLEIIEKNINEASQNTTRFAVLTRTLANDGRSDDKHSILMFTVRNEAGSLAKAINIIGLYGYNLRCLRSRPMKELMWQYYFYAEAEGDLANENGKMMMVALANCCDKLRMFGSFKYPADL